MNVKMSVKERVGDAVLTILLFSPLVVCYWAGTWQLLDIYLLPSNLKLSAFVSFSLSIIVMGGCFFVQDVLNKSVKPDKHFTYVVVSRLYTYITAFATVNSWRGMWNLMDIYTGVTLLGAVINVSVGVIGLVLLRSYRNVIVSPGGWVMDVDMCTHFTVLTRFRKQKGGILYLLDVVFGLVVVSPLALLVWRGKWQLLQNLIGVITDNDLWRAVIKTITAHILLGIIAILQYPARNLSGHLHTTSYWSQLVLEDFFVFIVCYTSIIYWQGLWNLLNMMLADFDEHMTLWPIHLIGFGGLMVLNLSRSLQFTGFFIDAEFPDGLGLVTTPTYLRTFMKTSDTLEKLTRETQKANARTVCLVMDTSGEHTVGQSDNTDSVRGCSVYM